jgi:hypothetical protein
MQKQFLKSPMIRKMVDLIPKSVISAPMMVLQPLEESLWDARNNRPFTVDEIKWIMQAVLMGLGEIHLEGLVYSGKSLIPASSILINILLDLKIENVLLKGFKRDAQGNLRSIIARLADCGTSTFMIKNSLEESF